MSFKTLLVHVEANTSPDVRLSLAVNLANQLHAKLIGVGAEFFRSPYYAGDGVDYFAGDLIAAEMESIESDLKRAEAKFRRAAAALSEGHDWRGSVRFPVTAVAAEARAADLVVTSLSGGQGASDYNIALPAALILQAGRPVLVAPPDTAQLTVAGVVVAWKDTREARRAVSDALPFLQGAEEVHLVELCDGPEAIPAATGRLTDVADYLLRHGVSATIGAEIESQDANAPHQLLDVAERHNADLIVAGAYGHSRLREWVFGGFTRALLSQTKRAVLFGH